jgi:hypothetical protein
MQLEMLTADFRSVVLIGSHPHRGQGPIPFRNDLCRSSLEQPIIASVPQSRTVPEGVRGRGSHDGAGRQLQPDAVRKRTFRVDGRDMIRSRVAAVALATLGTSIAGAAIAVAPASAIPPPVGGCPTGWELITVRVVLKNISDPNGLPSLDGNGDGWTCVNFGFLEQNGRVAFTDNTLPL